MGQPISAGQGARKGRVSPAVPPSRAAVRNGDRHRRGPERRRAGKVGFPPANPSRVVGSAPVLQAEPVLKGEGSGLPSRAAPLPRALRAPVKISRVLVL